MAIRREFAPYIASAEESDVSVALGQIFTRALDDVCTLVPASRELSLAITHMQTAFFFAKRGACPVQEDPGNYPVLTPMPNSGAK